MLRNPLYLVSRAEDGLDTRFERLSVIWLGCYGSGVVITEAADTFQRPSPASGLVGADHARSARAWDRWAIADVADGLTIDRPFSSL